MYKVGDKVVYPHHGAGTVVKREKREVLGEKREYLTIKILHNDMTVNVPADNAERVGLRKVIDEEAVKKVVKYLTSGGTEMPKNWNRRFKHNRDKMKTGDIYELAEVVRNLALRDGEKGLSTGEKQMYVKAKKILASELMYAKNMSEDEALEWLEETLTEGAKPKKPRRRRSRAAAAKPSRCRGEDDGRSRREETGSAEAGGRAVERLGRSRRRGARGAAWGGPAEGVRSPRRPALLAEPLRRLDESDWIDAIVVVAPPGWEEPAILLAEEMGASKVRPASRAARPEPTRSAQGVAEVPGDAAVILVHDAARPLVTDEIGAPARAPSGRVRRRRPRPAPHGHRQARAATRRRDPRPATSSSRCRRRRLSSRPCSELVLAATPSATDCASLVEASGGRVRRRGRRTAAQGDDARRPRAHLGMAVEAVVFDVGETLVDETGMWTRAAAAAG